MINRLAHALLLLALACGDEDKGTGPVPEPGPDPVAEPDPEAALFAAEVGAVREGCENDCIAAAATGESDDYGGCFVSCVWEGEKELWKVRMLEVVAELQDEGVEVGISVSDLSDRYFPEIIGSEDTPRIWAMRLALWEVLLDRDWETARLLVEMGADINFTFKDGRTALTIAVMAGDVKTVRLLVEKGAEVNFTYKNGRTVLTIAAMAGNGEIVRFLLEQGADLPGDAGIFFLPGGGGDGVCLDRGGSFHDGLTCFREGSRGS